MPKVFPPKLYPAAHSGTKAHQTNHSTNKLRPEPPEPAKSDSGVTTKDPNLELGSLLDHNICRDPETERRVNFEEDYEALNYKYGLGKLQEVLDKESMDEAIEETVRDYSPDLKHNIRSSSVKVRAGNTDDNQKIRNKQQLGNNKEQNQRAVEYFSINLLTSSITDS
ncbi:hypothetical protein RUND412_000664 [Rhizina undulata]